MKVKLIVVVAWCLTIQTAIGSQSVVDSLQERLKVPLSQPEQIDAKYQLAKYYFSQDQYWLSELYLLEAASLHNNDTLNASYAQQLLSLSAVKNKQNSFGKAFNYATRAASIADLSGDEKLLASALNNAAIALKDEGRFEQAKPIAMQSLSIFEKLQDSLNMSFALNTLGTVYNGMGIKDSAKACYRQSMSLKKKFGNLTDQLNSLGNIANLYTNTGFYDTAFVIYRHVIEKATASKLHYLLAKTYLNLAELYAKNDDDQSALQYADSAKQVALVHNLPVVLKDVYSQKAEIAAENGDFESAWAYKLRFEKIDDSLTKDANKRSLDESALVYRIRQHELQVAKLKLKNAGHRMLFYLIALIVLSIVVLVISLRSAKLRRAKEAIRVSEKKFKMMAEDAPDVIWTSDLNLNLNYINAATEALFGYPREERLKMPMRRIYDDSSVQKIKLAIKERVADYERDASKIKPIVVDLKGRHKNGHDVWVEVVVEFSMDEKGKMTGLQGIARNITNRKETQIEMMRLLEDLRLHDEKLKAQNEELINANQQTEKAVEQYFDLFENSPAGYIILNTGGQVEEINNMAAKLIGKDKKFIYGQNFISFFQGEHRSEFARMLVNTINQLKPNQQELKMGNTDVKILFVPDTTSGKLKCRLALVDISNEVSARKKLSLALLSLQTIFDAIPGGIAVIDTEYRIVNINNRLIELHKLKSREDVIGKACYEVFDCGNTPCGNCLLNEVRQRETTLIKSIQHDNPRYSDGFYQIYASPIYDNNGLFSGIVEVVMDVSDLRKAEDALAASERKFEELFNDIPDAVFITRVGENSGDVIDVNPAAEKQTGYTREELLRMNILRDISMLKADELITAEREINLLNREKIELTEQKRRKDGTRIWTEVVVQRIEIDGVICALSVSRDISERKAIEEKLKLSRNRIMSILNAIPDIIFILNDEGVYLEYHTNEESTLYTLPEFFLNKRVDQVMPEYLANLTFEKIKKTIDTGISQVYNYELEINNEKLHFESRMVKSSNNTVLTIVRDITQTVKAGEEVIKNEEKYKAIFLNAPVGVFNFDEHGTILDCNDLFVRIIGSSREALIGFNMLDSVKNSELKNVIRASINHGSGFYEGYYSSVTANKTTPVKAYFKSISDDKGNFVDGIGMIDDITDQKKYEQELVAARTLAEQSDRLKSSFMATMSHELRTPLNTIIGFADMMDPSLPVDQVTEFADVISKSGKQLLSIIEDILDISLIDSGEVKLSQEKIVLGHYAESLMVLAQQEKLVAGKNHLSVKLSIPANMRDKIIYGDTHKLNKVFAQIIKNAFKFTREGSVEIGIVKKPESDISENILFYVKDSGIGISKEQQEFIFDVFRQVDESSTREFEGTGLGLAISKKLVELMHGKIWVASDLGKGSTFFVEIPSRGIANNKSIQEHHNVAHLDGSVSKGEDLILLAEDDDNSFNFFNVLLKKAMTDVVRAQTGYEAISIVEQLPAVRLVLMNIDMPTMDGLEAVVKIKNIRPDLKVIALTNYSMQGDKAAALHAGFDDFIAKPVNNKLFVQAIMHYLQS